MLIINCPICGPRPEIEFRHAGEAHVPRPAATETLDDTVVADRLYMRSNPKGLIAERWRHNHGCGKYFNAIRDTISDFFVTTYKAGEPKPDLEQIAREMKR